MRIAQIDTACAAFRAHQESGNASAQRNRIVRFIANCGGDWSIGELANAMGLEKSTVSARINECLHSGELQVKPRRADRRSGIRVRPVGLPELQIHLFGGEQ